MGDSGSEELEPLLGPRPGWMPTAKQRACQANALLLSDLELERARRLLVVVEEQINLVLPIRPGTIVG